MICKKPSRTPSTPIILIPFPFLLLLFRPISSLDSSLPSPPPLLTLTNTPTLHISQQRNLALLINTPAVLSNFLDETLPQLIITVRVIEDGGEPDNLVVHACS